MRMLLIALGAGCLAFVLTISRSWLPWIIVVCALALMLRHIHAHPPTSAVADPLTPKSKHSYTAAQGVTSSRPARP